MKCMWMSNVGVTFNHIYIYLLKYYVNKFEEVLLAPPQFSFFMFELHCVIGYFLNSSFELFQVLIFNENIWSGFVPTSRT